MVLSELFQAVQTVFEKDQDDPTMATGASFVPKEFHQHEAKKSNAKKSEQVVSSTSSDPLKKSKDSDSKDESNDKSSIKENSHPKTLENKQSIRTESENKIEKMEKVEKLPVKEASLPAEKTEIVEKVKKVEKVEEVQKVEKMEKVKKVEKVQEVEKEDKFVPAAPFSLSAASAISIKTESAKKDVSAVSTSSSKDSVGNSASPDDESSSQDSSSDVESSSEEEDEALKAKNEADALTKEDDAVNASSDLDGKKKKKAKLSEKEEETTTTTEISTRKKKGKPKKPKKPPPQRHIRMFCDTDKVTMGLGKPKPHGCSSEQKDGSVLNFALLAPNSKVAWFIIVVPPGHSATDLFDIGDGDTSETPYENHRELYVKLEGEAHRTGGSWHLDLTMSESKAGDLTGINYAWLIDPPPNGPWDEPSRKEKRIIDPYARSLDSTCAMNWNVRTEKKYAPLPVVPNFKTSDFDWQGVKSPGYELKDLIIYEAHVRGFTMNPDSAVTTEHAGTFLGFVEKIPHLLNLGVNCVELLPIFEFDETCCPLKNPHNQELLCNYWGYNTVAFFVPMQRYASKETIGSAIIEFKTLVRELHRNGIEVILDVVFNHTGEGCWGENNWASWSQVALQDYYLMIGGNHCNYTGCGNTMNANHGTCAEWICECLRYWTCEMHVDGFRFDLASSLTRGSNGQCNIHDPYLIKLIVTDAKLKHVKLIAEPWDCAWPDGQLVGIFPQGPTSAGPPRWAEWNGEFRDTMRKFIKGDPDQKSTFATRLCGSSDLYEESGRAPFHSINFVTAHDGFTMRDLVSFNKKQNSVCGENSGEDNNHSWNCVADGQNDGDEQVAHLRQKQQKNFLTALLLSHGTPMMTFGDEYGRTQNGCNNGWNQDKLSWFSWADCENEAEGMFRFTRQLIALRKEFGDVINRTTFVGEDEIWFRTNWDDPYNYLCYVLHHHKSTMEYRGLLVAFNSGHQEYTCELPEDKTWYRIIDTNLESPDDFAEEDEDACEVTGTYQMSPYSCIVLKTVQSMQEFQFQVHCDCSSPGEVVCVVGDPPALGVWLPEQGLVCTTSEADFPIWSSPFVPIPVSSTGSFDFKLCLRGEHHVHWEEGENHEVLMPDTLKAKQRVIVKSAWGLAKVACYLDEYK